MPSAEDVASIQKSDSEEGLAGEINITKRAEYYRNFSHKLYLLSNYLLGSSFIFW